MAQQRRYRNEGYLCDSPMSSGFREDDDGKWFRGQRQLLETAVLEVITEHAVERQQRGQQGGHPNHAWPYGSQHFGVLAHGQRKQGAYNQEKDQR